ncbi:MAG: HPr family phosphocarrier protein [Planctomycetota bacterium]
MTETSLEQLVQERQFAGILQTHGEVFLRLSNSLLALGDRPWNKKHHFQLINESDSLESFLDDYGARYNRTYAFFTELVASLRWFAMTGYSLSHAQGRLGSYGAGLWHGAEGPEVESSLRGALAFAQRTGTRLLAAIREEAETLGLEITPEAFPESNFLPVVSRRKLPRNVGQAELEDEEQKIAEVASKFLAACDMLRETGVRPIADVDERRRYLKRSCTEELARVYEATVHNLQSTYDTHIQNTVLEGKDERLLRLRGHVSGALHLLASVTYLTHFFERHEDELRAEEVKQRIGALVDRAEVQGVTLDLLVLANRILQEGRELAEALLPEYTNVLELQVEVADGLVMHARPAALIVSIVNHYGTPVEMEVGGQTCNAASILELLVCVGSHPDERRFSFRGDENPLRDIRSLFESGLGEEGLDSLPDSLAYLRS